MKVIKNNIKKLILVIIIIIVTSRGIYVHNRNIYYNYYFENNKNDLILIKDYVVKNNLEGHIYTNTNKYTNIVTNIKNASENCFGRKCKVKEDILNLLDYLNLDYLAVISGNITMNTKWPLYGSLDNELYYSKGYYKGKKELDMIKGDEFNRIIKIFDDDWGVMSSCYDCGGGGWD